MRYNVSFLMAALIFLLLILYHFLNCKRLENTNSRVFGFFIKLGIADIVLDLICTVLMTTGEPEFRVLTTLLLTAFYLMQTLVPCGLFLYAQSLRNRPAHQNFTWFTIWTMPAVFMGLMVVYNVYSGIFFFIEEEGTYQQGPWYLTMYFYALFYGVMILVNSILHYRELGFKKFCVIGEFLVIMGCCVVVQALNRELLMTGFGLGLGILVLYLTINNPAEYVDNLTGVLNIQSFLGWAQECINGKKSFHVITVDLYQLKRINMIFGTDFGDQFLCKVAEELQLVLDTPYVFRTTSKRFVMLTYTLFEYERVRTEVQRFFRESLSVGAEQLTAAAVICGILNGEKLKDCDTLLAYIDYMVSLAPMSEQSILLQSDEKTLKGFKYNNEIESYLNTAIEKDLFELYYQPVFSIDEGKVVSLEALSRLRHPVYGYISPEIFIGLAEKNSQITRIGYLQFRRLCRFLKDHKELMGRLRNVKFNLSPAELLKDGYGHRLVETIREFELPFSWFQFEITETVATEYSDKLYQAVSDFRECGIGLCLDDFGSGYANLDTVLRLPFSCIKLDRTLLRGIISDEKAILFYQNIVSVLKNMGYCVIAEGVEREEEVKALKQWGVNMIQGYYFSKPLNQEEVIKKIL